MTLTAKPPEAWTDHDMTVFEALAADRAGWFHRLESLYYERSRAVDPAFEVRRLTLTAPDGTEVHELLRVDGATRELVSEALHDALQAIDARIGSEAPRALLGALAVKVLEPAAAERAEPTRKARTA
jgi:hypothetical protein